MNKKINDGYANLAKKIRTKEGVVLEGSWVGVSGLLENIITMPVLDSFNTGISSDSNECKAEFQILKEVIKTAIIESRRSGESIVVKREKRVIRYDNYTATTIDLNPLSKTYLEYGSVEIVNGGTLKAGEFITVRNNGSLEFIEQNYRGYRVDEVVGDSVARYISSISIATDVLATLNQSVIKMQDLHDVLRSEGGEEQLMKRLDVINYLKSNLSTLLLDKEDEYINVNKSLSGVDSVIAHCALDVCSVAKIPYSRLFGRGYTGLNNSGEGDLKTYYDTVVGDIREKITFLFNNLTDNRYINKWEWLPLMQPTQKEKAEALEKDVSTLLKLLELDIITEDELRAKIGFK